MTNSPTHRTTATGSIRLANSTVMVARPSPLFTRRGPSTSR